LCPVPCSNAQCSTPNCYKVVHISQPDCRDPYFNGTLPRSSQEIETYDVQIFPNPVVNNRFTILSSLETTSFEIFTLSGQSIQRGIFRGREFDFNAKSKLSGLYFLKYIDVFGKIKVIRFIAI
jgi:hypothetical protein